MPSGRLQWGADSGKLRAAISDAGRLWFPPKSTGQWCTDMCSCSVVSMFMLASERGAPCRSWPVEMVKVLSRVKKLPGGNARRLGKWRLRCLRFWS